MKYHWIRFNIKMHKLHQIVDFYFHNKIKKMLFLSYFVTFFEFNNLHVV